MSTDHIPNPLPPKVTLVDDDGMPIGAVDVDRVQSRSILFGYLLAEACGSKDRLDALAVDWASRIDPTEFGWICAGAARHIAENVLAPVLEVVDELAPQLGRDLRAGLGAAVEQAQSTLDSL